jgi:hypothetical protein
MNLEDVQPWIASLLASSPGLAGVSVIEDDGTYPKTPGREEALSTQGLCLVVWQIESDGLLDDVPKGAAIETLKLVVVVEENAAVCRGSGGVNIRAEKALRLARAATVGKRHSSDPGAALRPGDPPFKNFGTTNGVQRIAMFLALEQPIVPS